MISKNEFIEEIANFYMTTDSLPLAKAVALAERHWEERHGNREKIREYLRRPEKKST